MSTLDMKPITVAKTISGNSPQLMNYPEAATQTFKRGEVVYLVSGKVTEIAGDTPSQILGIAADDASGTTDTSIGVWIANDDTIFSASYSDDSQAAAATAVSIVGFARDIDRDTANGRVYVSSTAAGRRVTVFDLDNRDVTGDSGGRVLFQFLRQFSQLFSTS